MTYIFLSSSYLKTSEFARVRDEFSKIDWLVVFYLYYLPVDSYKFKPYLCWGTVGQQKAIDNENEKRQQGSAGNANLEVESLSIDEPYLPTIKVC